MFHEVDQDIELTGPMDGKYYDGVTPASAIEILQSLPAEEAAMDEAEDSGKVK